MNSSYYKTILETILVIVTTCMMVVTAWQAYETRQLKKADIGPNISLFDVNTTFFDTKGLEVRKTSWVNGELSKIGNKFTKVDKVNQSLRFSNTGKNSGYVKLLNQKTSENYSLFNHEKNDEGVYYLVPALGETGEIYTFDLRNALDMALDRDDKYFQIDYEIETFDSNKIKLGVLGVSIYCEMNVINVIEVECVPFYK